MNGSELVARWGRRDERYAEHPRPLSDGEIEAIRAHREREARAIAGPMSEPLVNQARSWSPPFAYGR